MFYMSAVLAFVWFFVWVLLIASEPRQHFLISQKECEFIENNRANKMLDRKKESKLRAPWLKIMSSRPVLVTILIKFTGACNFMLVMTKVPAYLQAVLHYPISKVLSLPYCSSDYISCAQNGYMMAIIYVAIGISMSSGGIITDYIINKQIIKNKTRVRKLFQTIGLCF